MIKYLVYPSQAKKDGLLKLCEDKKRSLRSYSY